MPAHPHASICHEQGQGKILLMILTNQKLKKIPFSKVPRFLLRMVGLPVNYGNLTGLDVLRKYEK
jgi:hypothetical protein